MTRVRSRVSATWDDERVDLRIALHFLESRGVNTGAEHLELSTRIKELNRLISEDLGYRAARG